MMVTNLFPVLTGQILTGFGNLGRSLGAKDDGESPVTCNLHGDHGDDVLFGVEGFPEVKMMVTPL